MAQLSPIFNIPYFTDNSGSPLAGGRIFTYEAGSNSVLKVTYTDEGSTVANTNPIVLDAAGRLPGGTVIWLTAGEFYNLVLTAPDATTVLKSFDDVSGVVVSTGGGGGGSTSVWVTTAGATYLSGTSFLVTGNQAANYAIGNRVRITQSGGFTYGVVTSVSFAGGNTTVIVQANGPAFNPSLTEAAYSVLFAAPNATVDAGGVSYFDTLPYALANTVGNKVKGMSTNLTSLTNKVTTLRQVWQGTGSGPIVVTVDPAITSYSADQVFTVRFQSASSSPATININGVGPVALAQYDVAGNLGNPIIAANQVSDIAYNGTSFVLLDALPPAAVLPPHGLQAITGNSNYTVPPGVYSIKVTCIGGGGGGASGFLSGNETQVFYNGGGGGGAATATRIISTTPGQVYPVSIGVGGTGGDIGPGANGTNGGTTTFGITLVVASGAAGGIYGTNPAGGAAGTTGTGDVVIPGSAGAVGAIFNPGFSAVGGGGYGFGGMGGEGTARTNGNGVNGRPGICIVEY